MNTDAKFRFAHLDNDKEIIHINDVNSDVRNNHKFWCIGCGGELKAALGSKRIHYFSHKVNESHCSRETYLHKLGKQKVISAFNTQEQFPIVLRSLNKCERYQKCNLKKHVRECTEIGDVHINLKEHYGRCEEEYRYKGFVADVALIAKEEHRSPIFIEIVVTHKCSEEKRKSGIHIIEWTISDENDVEHILFMQKRPNIEFINFNDNKPRYLPPPILLDKVYVKDIGGRLIASMEKETIKCYEQNKRTNESSVLEIVSNDVEHGAQYFFNCAIGIAIRKLGNRFKWCDVCVNTFRCTGLIFTQQQKDGTIVRKRIARTDGSLSAYCNYYVVHPGLQQQFIRRYSNENCNIVYVQTDESETHDSDADASSTDDKV